MQHLSRTLRYVLPYRKLVVCSCLLILAGSAFRLLGPWPLSFLIDTVLSKNGIPQNALAAFLANHLGAWAIRPVSLIVLYVFASLLITAMDHGIAVIESYVNTKLDLRMELDFRSEMFQQTLRLSLARHEQRQSGMLMYLVNNLGDAAPRLIMVLPGLIQNLLTLIGMLWIALLIDWQLALLALIVIPFLYYSVGYYVTHIQERLYEVKTMEGNSMSIIHEALSMIRVIVAFGGESREHTRFREQGELATDARIRLTVRQAAFALAVETTTALGAAMVLGLGAVHVLDNRLSVGQLLVVVSYINSVYRPLEAISSTVGSVQDVFISLKMAYELLDSQPDIQDAPDAIDIDRARGDVVFENVSFSYSEREDTLDNISFEARSGQIIAVVGPTGAGKTTLISLLPRFYDPSHGRILLDGTDIRKLTLKSLRQQVSIVLQEPLLFSGTIRDNIRYGRPDASEDAIVEAAQAANAHDFIMQLPQKYETELGERGATLSGGERQRISVARAFLKDAPILILDEPTSSIDSRTEEVILDALERHMAGRTTFMIAHRLSTIRRADIILVLDHGELVEHGSHDELIELGGLYHRLYTLQTKSAGSRLL